MKPDIIKWCDPRCIDGHVGVFCRCGRTLYIKNIPSKAKQLVDVECPCGEVINTMYTRYSHN